MIRLAFPSFVFHAHDISPKFYSMWRTVEGQPGETAAQVAAKIYGSNVAARHTFGTSLKNVVLNVHGSPGAVYIGGLKAAAGTFMSDLLPFGILNGSGIETIWIVSCDVAREQVGEEFCKHLSRSTGSIVIGALEPQEVTFWDGFRLALGAKSAIDSYEGEMVAFRPNGTFLISRSPGQLVRTLARPVQYRFKFPPR